MTSPPLLRPALPTDAPAIAEVFMAARATMTYLPRLHTDEETRIYFARLVATQCVIVAVTQSAPDDIAGFAAINDREDEAPSDEHDKKIHLDHLYVRPERHGEKIGTTLLNAVKTLRRQGFALWCFQANIDARRFYERHGLTLAKTTDGRDNEENLPDMLYVWVPRDTKEIK